MERGSTLFLRGAVLALCAYVLAVCIFVLPIGIISEKHTIFLPFLSGLYVPVIPFFIAVHQAWKLLGYIDAGKAFSDLSVQALSVIKYCALAIGGLFVFGLPYMYMIAQQEDAPGIMIIGLAFVFAPLVISTLAALAERVLKDAIAIKSENDLTV